MVDTDKINYSHGDTGTRPSDGNQFEGNERPDAQRFDWFWYTITSKVDSIIGDLTAIANGTQTVGEAENTQTVKGEDIDSNGDGRVDEADSAAEAIGTFDLSGDLRDDAGATVYEDSSQSIATKRLAHDTFDHSMSGQVAADSANTASLYAVEPGETLVIDAMTVRNSIGSEVPNDVRVVIASRGTSSFADGSVETVLYEEADGSGIGMGTRSPDDTSVGSYTNNTSSRQLIGVFVDNGHFYSTNSSNYRDVALTYWGHYE